MRPYLLNRLLFHRNNLFRHLVFIAIHNSFGEDLQLSIQQYTIHYLGCLNLATPGLGNPMIFSPTFLFHS